MALPPEYVLVNNDVVYKRRLGYYPRRKTDRADWEYLRSSIPSDYVPGKRPKWRSSYPLDKMPAHVEITAEQAAEIAEASLAEFKRKLAEKPEAASRRVHPPRTVHTGGPRVNITITQRYTCPDCATVGKGFKFPKVRILKQQLVQETALGVWPKPCAGCGHAYTPADRTEDVIDPADLERINRRRTKWGWEPMPAVIPTRPSTPDTQEAL